MRNANRTRRRTQKRALRAPFRDEVFLLTRNSVYRGHGVDLSCSGLAFWPERPISHYGPARLIFELPETPDDPYASPRTLSLEVTRARFDPRTGVVGVAFARPPRELTREIDRYVFTSTVDRLGKAITRPSAPRVAVANDDTPWPDVARDPRREVRALFRAALRQVARGQGRTHGANG